jgi:peptidylprolyl isomerase
VSRENKARSDAFMAANKGKPGVTVLPSGVQYRVIEPGSGAKPTAASTIQMHYRGSISTGQEFANTYAAASPTPASFKLSEFPIKGVRDTLMMMPTGARWEIFLPADQAFGNDPRSPVGPGQALVFDIKLVSVK